MDGAAVAARQPAAAHRSDAALALVRAGRRERHDLATIGNVPRGAIIDATHAVALPTPIDNITGATNSARRCGEERRDAADHAVTHARDEGHDERPPVDPAAVRRGALLTAVVGDELDQRPIAVR